MPATDRPVSPDEVSRFLAELRRLSEAGPHADPAERLAFFERKADLLTRIAKRDGTDEKRAVAEAACRQLAQIRAERSGHIAPREGGASCRE
jgi:hypothetical protein